MEEGGRFVLAPPLRFGPRDEPVVGEPTNQPHGRGETPEPVAVFFTGCRIHVGRAMISFSRDFCFFYFSSSELVVCKARLRERRGTQSSRRAVFNVEKVNSPRVVALPFSSPPVPLPPPFPLPLAPHFFPAGENRAGCVAELSLLHRLTRLFAFSAASWNKGKKGKSAKVKVSRQGGARAAGSVRRPGRARVSTRARDIMSLSTSPILAAAASNDLQGIRWLVEREAVPLDMIGDW